MFCCARDKDKEMGIIEHETDKEYYKKALKAETNILKRHTNLQLNYDIEARNIQLHDRDKNWIHSVVFGTKHHSKDPFLLIHGYGSASCCYYKLFNALSQERTGYAIDLLGMGLSSRPDFTLTDLNDCIDFFVDSIETFRRQVKAQRFIVLGHSFGGYIASRYALKYPQNVRTLHLISPLGTTKMSKEQIEAFENKMIEDMGFVKGFIFVAWVRRAWENKKTPTSFYSDTPLLPTKWLMDSYLDKLGLKGMEKQDIKTYADCIFTMKESSELAFHNMFIFPNMMAKEPLVDQFENLDPSISVHFYYGDHNDWMDRRGAQLINKQEKLTVTFHEVKDATHNVLVDHHKELLELIFENQKKYVEYPGEQEEMLKLEKLYSQQEKQLRQEKMLEKLQKCKEEDDIQQKLQTSNSDSSNELALNNSQQQQQQRDFIKDQKLGTASDNTLDQQKEVLISA